MGFRASIVPTLSSMVNDGQPTGISTASKPSPNYYPHGSLARAAAIVSLYKPLMPKIPTSKPERSRGFDVGA